MKHLVTVKKERLRRYMATEWSDTLHANSQLITTRSPDRFQLLNPPHSNHRSISLRLLTPPVHGTLRAVLGSTLSSGAGLGSSSPRGCHSCELRQPCQLSEAVLTAAVAAV